jgi:hypothetical protein
MQYKALNRSEIATLEEFKEKFANIEVNVPYASIFIDGPSTVVAGDNNTKNIKYKATVYPSDNELKDTLIKFDCVKLNESNPRNVTLEYYKGEDAQSLFTKILIYIQN